MEIILNSSKSSGISNKKNFTDGEIELQGWLILMTRYRDNKPIPVTLEESLYEHFKFYWTENRLPAVLESDFLDRLPR